MLEDMSEAMFAL